MHTSTIARKLSTKSHLDYNIVVFDVEHSPTTSASKDDVVDVGVGCAPDRDGIGASPVPLRKPTEEVARGFTGPRQNNDQRQM